MISCFMFMFSLVSIADCGVNEDEEQYDIQCISQVQYQLSLRIGGLR